MMTRSKHSLFAATAVLCLAAAAPVRAQSQPAASPADSKAEVYGAAMALQYGIDHCDIATTLKQRTDVKTKIATLKQQSGISGDIPEADIKDAIGLKTDADLKNYCTGMAMMLPGMIADMLADKPTAEWGKPATAAAAPAPATAPAPAAAAATTTAGDWEIEPVANAPGECMMTRDYNDPDDKNAENTIVLRGGSDQLRFVLQYARWNMTSGQQFEAALVTPDSVIAGDAKWTVDKTGKIIQTQLQPKTLAAFKSAKQIIVKFDSGDATFEVPKIDEAVAALTTCTSKK